LLTRLGQLGFLPSMYSTISGRDPSKTKDEWSIVVLPEHFFCFIAWWKKPDPL
jgi:hypothetical protein